MNINLHSHYDFFKNHHPVEGEPYIDCYSDNFIIKEFDSIKPNSIALLGEPRPLQPRVYDFVEKNYFKFKYIFTHDSILLNKLPNAKLMLWTKLWNCTYNDIEKDFEHPISMVASYKEQAPVRIQRKQLAFELKGKIDTYGTFDGGEHVEPVTVYGKYPFSVVMENHIDDWWVTEKIVNCFACNTVPIYYGARNVGQLFNTDGMVICHSVDEIRKAVNYLLFSAKTEYALRQRAINDNRYKIERYASREDWFYRQYGELLEKMGER